MLISIVSLFVPNQYNNHKAHLLHNYGLALILSLIIGIQSGIAIFTLNKHQVLGTTINLDPQEIVELTNQARQHNNLPVLKTNEQLQVAAEAKLQDMIEFNYWDHYSPSKRTPWKFILDAGYSYRIAGENLGRNFQDPQALVDAWMESPGHRANILNSEYEDIGVATAIIETEDSITVLIVQFFGTQAEPGSYVITEDAGFQAPGEVSQVKLEQVSNPGLTTQMIALITIAVLAIILTIDAYIIHRHKNIPRVSAQYWAHMVFLYGLGIITYLSYP